jgi:hypothetical protein
MAFRAILPGWSETLSPRSGVLTVCSPFALPPKLSCFDDARRRISRPLLKRSGFGAVRSDFAPPVAVRSCSQPKAVNAGPVNRETAIAIPDVQRRTPTPVRAGSLHPAVLGRERCSSPRGPIISVQRMTNPEDWDDDLGVRWNMQAKAAPN